MEGSIILLVLIGLWTWGAYRLGERIGSGSVRAGGKSCATCRTYPRPTSNAPT